MDKSALKADYMQQLFKEMTKCGIFNQMQSVFLSDVTQEIANSNINEMKTYIEAPNDKANELASQVVLQFLERNELSNTSQAANSESNGFLQKRQSDYNVCKELGLQGTNNLLCELVKAHEDDFNEPSTIVSDAVSTIVSQILDSMDESIQTSLPDEEFEDIYRIQQEQMRARNILPEENNQEDEDYDDGFEEEDYYYEEDYESKHYVDAGETFRSALNKKHSNGDGGSYYDGDYDYDKDNQDRPLVSYHFVSSKTPSAASSNSVDPSPLSPHQNPPITNPTGITIQSESVSSGPINGSLPQSAKELNSDSSNFTSIVGSHTTTNEGSKSNQEFTPYTYETITVDTTPYTYETVTVDSYSEADPRVSNRLNSKQFTTEYNYTTQPDLSNYRQVASSEVEENLLNGSLTGSESSLSENGRSRSVSRGREYAGTRDGIPQKRRLDGPPSYLDKRTARKSSFAPGAEGGESLLDGQSSSNFSPSSGTSEDNETETTNDKSKSKTNEEGFSVPTSGNKWTSPSKSNSNTNTDFSYSKSRFNKNNKSNESSLESIDENIGKNKKQRLPPVRINNVRTSDIDSFSISSTSESNNSEYTDVTDENGNIIRKKLPRSRNNRRKGDRSDEEYEYTDETDENGNIIHKKVPRTSNTKRSRTRNNRYDVNSDEEYEYTDETDENGNIIHKKVPRTSNTRYRSRNNRYDDRSDEEYEYTDETDEDGNIIRKKVTKPSSTRSRSRYNRRDNDSDEYEYTDETDVNGNIVHKKVLKPSYATRSRSRNNRQVSSIDEDFEYTDETDENGNTIRTKVPRSSTTTRSRSRNNRRDNDSDDYEYTDETDENGNIVHKKVPRTSTATRSKSRSNRHKGDRSDEDFEYTDETDENGNIIHKKVTKPSNTRSRSRYNRRDNDSDEYEYTDETDESGNIIHKKVPRTSNTRSRSRNNRQVSSIDEDFEYTDETDSDGNIIRTKVPRTSNTTRSRSRNNRRDNSSDEEYEYTDETDENGNIIHKKVPRTSNTRSRSRNYRRDNDSDEYEYTDETDENGNIIHKKVPRTSNTRSRSRSKIRDDDSDEYEYTDETDESGNIIHKKVTKPSTAKRSKPRNNKQVSSIDEDFEYTDETDENGNIIRTKVPRSSSATRSKSRYRRNGDNDSDDYEYDDADEDTRTTHRSKSAPSNSRANAKEKKSKGRNKFENEPSIDDDFAQSTTSKSYESENDISNTRNGMKSRSEKSSGPVNRFGSPIRHPNNEPTLDDDDFSPSGTTSDYETTNTDDGSRPYSTVNGPKSSQERFTKQINSNSSEFTSQTTSTTQSGSTSSKEAESSSFGVIPEPRMVNYNKDKSSLAKIKTIHSSDFDNTASTGTNSFSSTNSGQSNQNNVNNQRKSSFKNRQQLSSDEELSSLPSTSTNSANNSANNSPNKKQNEYAAKDRTYDSSMTYEYETVDAYTYETVDSTEISSEQEKGSSLPQKVTNAKKSSKPSKSQNKQMMSSDLMSNMTDDSSLMSTESVNNENIAAMPSRYRNNTTTSTSPQTSKQIITNVASESTFDDQSYNTSNSSNSPNVKNIKSPRRIDSRELDETVSTSDFSPSSGSSSAYATYSTMDSSSPKSSPKTSPKINKDVTSPPKKVVNNNYMDDVSMDTIPTTYESESSVDPRLPSRLSKGTVSKTSTYDSTQDQVEEEKPAKTRNAINNGKLIPVELSSEEFSSTTITSSNTPTSTHSPISSHFTKTNVNNSNTYTSDITSEVSFEKTNKPLHKAMISNFDDDSETESHSSQFPEIDEPKLDRLRKRQNNNNSTVSHTYTTVTADDYSYTYVTDDGKLQTPDFSNTSYESEPTNKPRKSSISKQNNSISYESEDPSFKQRKSSISKQSNSISKQSNSISYESEDPRKVKNTSDRKQFARKGNNIMMTSLSEMSESSTTTSENISPKKSFTNKQMKQLDSVSIDEISTTDSSVSGNRFNNQKSDDSSEDESIDEIIKNIPSRYTRNSSQTTDSKSNSVNSRFTQQLSESESESDIDKSIDESSSIIESDKLPSRFRTTQQKQQKQFTETSDFDSSSTAETNNNYQPARKDFTKRNVPISYSTATTNDYTTATTTTADSYNNTRSQTKTLIDAIGPIITKTITTESTNTNYTTYSTMTNEPQQKPTNKFAVKNNKNNDDVNLLSSITDMTLSSSTNTSSNQEIENKLPQRLYGNFNQSSDYSESSASPVKSDTKRDTKISTKPSTKRFTSKNSKTESTEDTFETSTTTEENDTATYDNPTEISTNNRFKVNNRLPPVKNLTTISSEISTTSTTNSNSNRPVQNKFVQKQEEPETTYTYTYSTEDNNNVVEQKRKPIISNPIQMRVISDLSDDETEEPSTTTNSYNSMEIESPKFVDKKFAYQNKYNNTKEEKFMSEIDTEPMTTDSSVDLPKPDPRRFAQNQNNSFSDSTFTNESQEMNYNYTKPIIRNNKQTKQQLINNNSNNKNNSISYTSSTKDKSDTTNSNSVSNSISNFVEKKEPMRYTNALTKVSGDISTTTTTSSSPVRNNLPNRFAVKNDDSESTFSETNPPVSVKEEKQINKKPKSNKLPLPPKEEEISSVTSYSSTKTSSISTEEEQKEKPRFVSNRQYGDQLTTLDEEISTFESNSSTYDRIPVNKRFVAKQNDSTSMTTESASIAMDINKAPINNRFFSKSDSESSENSERIQKVPISENKSKSSVSDASSLVSLVAKPNNMRQVTNIETNFMTSTTTSSIPNRINGKEAENRFGKKEEETDSFTYMTVSTDYSQEKQSLPPPPKSLRQKQKKPETTFTATYSSTMTDEYEPETEKKQTERKIYNGEILDSSAIEISQTSSTSNSFDFVPKQNSNFQKRQERTNTNTDIDETVEKEQPKLRRNQDIKQKVTKSEVTKQKVTKSEETKQKKSLPPPPKNIDTSSTASKSSNNNMNLIGTDDLVSNETTTTTNVMKPKSSLLSAFQKKVQSETETETETTEPTKEDLQFKPKPEPKPIRAALQLNGDVKILSSESSSSQKSPKRKQEETKVATAKLPPIPQAFQAPVRREKPVIKGAHIFVSESDQESSNSNTFTNDPVQIPNQNTEKYIKRPTATTSTTNIDSTGPKKVKKNLIDAIEGGKLINGDEEGMFSTITADTSTTNTTIDDNPKPQTFVLPDPDKERKQNRQRRMRRSAESTMDSSSSENHIRRRERNQQKELPKVPQEIKNEDEEHEQVQQRNIRRRRNPGPTGLDSNFSTQQSTTDTNTFTGLGKDGIIRPSNRFKLQWNPEEDSNID